MEQRLTIGRFSAMTRLSVKVLQHYDEIGLLPPAEVDPASGYRYYRLGQAGAAEAIRLLRGVDMPLPRIRELLATDDHAERLRLLAEHRARLAAERDRHERMVTFVEQLLNGEEQLMSYQITIVDVPAQPIVSAVRRTTLGGLEQHLDEVFPRLFAALRAADAAPAGPPMTIYHEIVDAETAGEVEIALPIAADAVVDPGDGLRVTELPAGPAVRTVHCGPYEQIDLAYHALTEWMAQRGHTDGGPPRESYLNDPTEVAADELLTEVTWPVR